MAALGGSVARRYARALFGMGVDGGNFEALGREIDEFAELLSSSPELGQTLANPVFSGSEKRAVLAQLLPRVTPTPAVQRFVMLLLERGRIVLMPAIARAYRDMMDLHLGRVRAKVTSAQPLDAGALDRVRKALERRTGKQVMLETAVDPALVGGLVARVGDLVLDGSVRTQLEDLRAKLLN
jgi:F-type H+-transporting ATPase subunit delta